MLTSEQVLTDVYQMLKDSALSSMISGAVYRDEENRPRDSRVEDMIIVFKTGVSGEVERGIVTVRIYVPDIDPFENGVMVKDGARIAELQRAAAEWTKTLKAYKSNYVFNVEDTINSFAESDIKQHFVSMDLNYRYYAPATD